MTYITNSLTSLRNRRDLFTALYPLVNILGGMERCGDRILPAGNMSMSHNKCGRKVESRPRLTIGAVQLFHMWRLRPPSCLFRQEIQARSTSWAKRGAGDASNGRTLVQDYQDTWKEGYRRSRCFMCIRGSELQNPWEGRRRRLVDHGVGVAARRSGP